jgi:hypothetical protein
MSGAICFTINQNHGSLEIEPSPGARLGSKAHRIISAIFAKVSQLSKNQEVVRDLNSSALDATLQPAPNGKFLLRIVSQRNPRSGVDVLINQRDASHLIQKFQPKEAVPPLNLKVAVAVQKDRGLQVKRLEGPKGMPLGPDARRIVQKLVEGAEVNTSCEISIFPEQDHFIARVSAEGKEPVDIEMTRQKAAMLIQPWKRAVPLGRRECKSDTSKYYVSRTYRNFQRALNDISSIRSPHFDVAGTAASWATYIPYFNGIGEKTSEILNDLSEPFQLTALLVDCVAMQQFLAGNNDKLKNDQSALTRLGLSMATGFCQVFSWFAKLGLPIGKTLIGRLLILGTLCAFTNSMLSLISEIQKGSSKLKLFGAMLGVACSLISVVLLFQAFNALNILSLVLSTTTLFLSLGSDGS